jgi:hypothetical protein
MERNPQELGKFAHSKECPGRQISSDYLAYKHKLTKHMQVIIETTSYIAEVLYYMLLCVQQNGSDTIRPTAVVSFYGLPHKELYEFSSKTYWTAQHLREEGIRVIDVESIKSVVMMAPDEQYQSWCKDNSAIDRWYLMEKPGIKISQMTGAEEFMTEE